MDDSFRFLFLASPLTHYQFSFHFPPGMRLQRTGNNYGHTKHVTYTVKLVRLAMDGSGCLRRFGSMLRPVHSLLWNYSHGGARVAPDVPNSLCSRIYPQRSEYCKLAYLLSTIKHCWLGQLELCPSLWKHGVAIRSCSMGNQSTAKGSEQHSSRQVLRHFRSLFKSHGELAHGLEYVSIPYRWHVCCILLGRPERSDLRPAYDVLGYHYNFVTTP